MKKINFEIGFDYEYHANRKGAKYFALDKFMNLGEMLENALKCELGFEYGYKDSVKFDKGSDIEELNLSVKSSGFSLASVYGLDMDIILGEYFDRVASSSWCYISLDNGKVVAYMMDRAEFEEFVRTWGYLTKESGCDKKKIKAKKESLKMRTWLEERVA